MKYPDKKITILVFAILILFFAPPKIANAEEAGKRIQKALEAVLLPLLPAFPPAAVTRLS